MRGFGVAEIASSLTLACGHEEYRRDIEFLLDELRPDERKLYECYYAKGLSVRDIAGVLERPEGTIKYQLLMMRGHLRDILSGKDRGLRLGAPQSRGVGLTHHER